MLSSFVCKLFLSQAEIAELKQRSIYVSSNQTCELCGKNILSTQVCVSVSVCLCLSCVFEYVLCVCVLYRLLYD